MEAHSHDGHDYYHYEDVIATYPALKKGCATKGNFLKRHDIESDRIYYARLIDGEWEVRDTPKQRDKLFIRKRDISKLINKLHDPLPDVINLDDEEMFRNVDGNLMHVNVVGKREHDQCYFCVKDLMNVFDMKSLDKAIMDERGTYKKDVHYKIFQLTRSLGYSVGNGISKTQLYLTYQGLIYMANISKNKNVKPYRKWILETLFTVQLGTKEAKRKLAGKLAGISITDIKAMCSTSSSLISCIYLFQIGTVGELRESLDLSDDLDDEDVLYKWGKTQDLGSRTYSHSRTYGEDIRLIYKSFVDKMHLTEAEAEIRAFFASKKYKINTKGHKEVSLITNKNMKSVKSMYDSISVKYQGRISTMNEELKEIKNVHEKELLRKDLIIAQKDAKIALHQKDMEIMELKLKLKSRK